MLKLLNLFGRVESMRAKRKALRVWFGSTQIRFRDGNPMVQVNNAKLRLSHPVRTLGGEWMVPVDFLTQVLPTLINQTVEYQVGEDRLFIGNINPNSFTLQLQPLSGGARLEVQFSAKVSLRTAARNGKWVLYLGNHPVEPIKSNFKFQNPYISRVHFDDHDGYPKLVVTPATSGLDFYPKLFQEGKLLVADVINPKVATAPPPPPVLKAPALPPPQPAPSQPSVPAASQAPAPAPQLNLSLPAVVLDAGHGGTDLGAHGSDGVLEKNLTAQMVARASQALKATGLYRVVLTRPGDQTVDFEQRATEANTAHPIAFISFHAGNLGTSAPRLMVYTYQPSSPEAPGAGTQLLFTSWGKVQLSYLSRSLQLAQDLQKDLEKTTGVAAAAPMEVPVRTLRSIAAPAVAIEVGSLVPGTNSAPLTKPAFQDQIAAAVVQALAEFQGGRPK